MAVDTRSFWQRPLSKRASHFLAAVLAGVALFLEGWIGRKRLFVTHDRHYFVAFILFIGAAFVLFQAFAIISKWVRIGKYRNRLSTLQTVAGMLTFLAILLFGLFSDYTLSKLNAQTVVESIITGSALAVWGGMSLKNPELPKE